MSKKHLSQEQNTKLIGILQKRFENNQHRHKGIDWNEVQARLEDENSKSKLWSLNEMEITGGEPDVTGYDEKSNEYIFTDCSAESPKGRRSFCYDRDALEARKEHKPKNSAMDLATSMGIELLSEDEYRELQKLESFDNKTSSWLKTPMEIRQLGGAIFGDYRYGQVFIYHNGVQSYYAARGFRGSLRV